MFSPGPDQWITALELNSPIVNDQVYDLIAVEKIKDSINNIENSPLFLIYNSNALHAPYQQNSETFSLYPNFSENGKMHFI